MGKCKVMCAISDVIWNSIQKYVVDGLDRTDDRLPSMLCNTCHKAVCELNKGQGRSRRISVYDHSKITTSRVTRSSECKCVVCEVATSMPAAFSNAAGVAALPMKKTIGRPRRTADQCAETPFAPKAIKRCSSCLSEVGRGLPHDCTKSTRLQNLQVMASSGGTPTAKEKLTAALLRDISSQPSGDSTETGVLRLASSRGKSVSLITLPTLKKPPCAKVLFSSENMATIQTNMNLSNKQTLELASHFRTASSSRTVVEPHLKATLLERNHRLDHLFSVEDARFVMKEDKNGVSWVNKPLVYCNDLQQLVMNAEGSRGKSYSNVKIGIDGGGGFLKVCLTLHNVNNSEQIAQRQRYSDGVAAKTLKDTSVKKLFIVALTPNVPENYRNVVFVWQKLGVEQLQQKWTVATDLKLANVLVGLMAHGSNHPCTWCTVSRDNLRLGRAGESRTLGSLRQMFWSWKHSNTAKTSAKDHGNVVHPPVFQLSNSTKVIDIVPPPELHLLIGPVTTMYHGLQKIWAHGAEEWARQCGVREQERHGGVFNGNACITLLHHVKKLQELQCPEKYVKAFAKFGDVVKACYGKEFGKDAPVLISEFGDLFKNLQLVITPKVHAVLVHIVEFCSEYQTGLGVWSEQASEAVHFDFEASTWQRYKVADCNPRYSQQLLRAVQDYAAKHL